MDIAIVGGCYKDMNIACWANSFGYPCGIYSCQMTEARLPMNYGILLAKYGHSVTLITNGGINASDKPANFEYSSTAGLSNRNFDICICTQDQYPPPVKAHRYIVIFYIPGGQRKYDGNVIRCRCIDYSIPDTELWCYPMDTPLLEAPNVSSYEMLYVCKHNPAPGKPLHTEFNRFLSVLKKFRNRYLISSLFFTSNPMNAFDNISHPYGLLYNELLLKLRTQRLSLTFFIGAQSFVESVNCGCLPLVWSHPSWKKGGDYFPVDTVVFRAEDSDKEFEDKMNEMLDLEYYNETWSKLYEYTKLHRYESSYSQFLNLIGEEV